MSETIIKKEVVTTKEDTSALGKIGEGLEDAAKAVGKAVKHAFVGEEKVTTIEKKVKPGFLGLGKKVETTVKTESKY